LKRLGQSLKDTRRQMPHWASVNYPLPSTHCIASTAVQCVWTAQTHGDTHTHTNSGYFSDVITLQSQHNIKHNYKFGFSYIRSRPQNRWNRPLTIDLRQIPINSIDRLDFWPFSQLSSTQRLGDRLDQLYRLYTWFLCICLGF